MKNPLTPAGIEPATFQIVAQHLNHCATAVPSYLDVIFNIHENCPDDVLILVEIRSFLYLAL